MTQIDDGGTQAEFTYNAYRQRVTKVDEFNTSRSYIYDDSKMVEEFDNSDDISTHYTHSLEDEYGNLVSQHQQDGIAWDSYFYQFDALGSTDAVTDENTDIKNQYIYSAFGKKEKETGDVDNNFTYVGAQGYFDDSPVNLYLLSQRYLDPDTGQFISEDPIGIDAGDVNYYRYVFNNPVNDIDPDGLTPVVSKITKYDGDNKILNLNSTDKDVPIPVNNNYFGNLPRIINESGKTNKAGGLVKDIPVDGNPHLITNPKQVKFKFKSTVSVIGLGNDDPPAKLTSLKIETIIINREFKTTNAAKLGIKKIWRIGYKIDAKDRRNPKAKYTIMLPLIKEKGVTAEIKKILTDKNLSGKEAKGCKLAFIKFKWNDLDKVIYGYTNPKHNVLRAFNKDGWDLFKAFNLDRFEHGIKLPPYRKTWLSTHKTHPNLKLNPRARVFLKRLSSGAKTKAERDRRSKRGAESLQVTLDASKILVEIWKLFQLSNNAAGAMIRDIRSLSVPIIYIGDEPTEKQVSEATKLLRTAAEHIKDNIEIKHDRAVIKFKKTAIVVNNMKFIIE